MVTLSTAQGNDLLVDYTVSVASGVDVTETLVRMQRLGELLAVVATPLSVHFDPVTNRLKATYGAPAGENLPTTAASRALPPARIRAVFESLLSNLDLAHDSGLLLGPIRAQDVFVSAEESHARPLVLGAGLDVPITWQAADDIQAVVEVIAPFVDAPDGPQAPEEVCDVIARHRAARVSGSPGSQFDTPSSLRQALTGAYRRPRVTGVNRRPGATNPFGSGIVSTPRAASQPPPPRPDPEEAPAQRRRVPLWPLLFLLFLTGGVVAWLATASDAPQAPGPAVSETPASALGTPAAPPTTPTTAAGIDAAAPTGESVAPAHEPTRGPEPRSTPSDAGEPETPTEAPVPAAILHRLTVTSTPAGATVYHGARRVGVTPVEVEVSAADFPAELRFELRGYVTLREFIGPSDEAALALHAELWRRPAAAAARPVQDAPRQPPSQAPGILLER